MNDKHDSDTNNKNEINELLEMFDFELISENDSPRKDIEIITFDGIDSNIQNGKNLEVAKKGVNSGFVKLMIASALVIATVIATLFLSEQLYKDKYTDKQIADLNQEETEKIENEDNETKNTTSTSSQKNVEIIKREFKEDPSVFVSYYDKINYYDMTLMLEENELIAVTPKLDNIFLMSEPMASSKKMVNMYIKDTDFAGVIGIYNNYLHVYFPIDDYEYYGWIRMGDVEFYNVDQDDNLNYMSADEFDEFISKRLVRTYYSNSSENEASEAIKPTENQSSSNSENSNASTVDSNAAKTSNYFTIGSSEDQVLAVMGNPSSVNDYTYFETWNYGISTIEFVDGKVSGYSNYDRNLKVWLGDKVSNSYFRLNSSKEDVLKANGTPTGIANYTYFETWSYGINTVEFSNDSVNGFSDYDKILNVNLGSAIEGRTFGIGSSKQDVLDANGTPTGVSDYGYSTTWNYGISSISFDRNGKVESYDNWEGNLKISF